MKQIAFLLFVALTCGCASDVAPHQPVKRQPRVLAMPLPAYSQELKSANIGGEVVVEFNVGPDGRAHDVSIVSSPDKRLSKVVLAASQDWRFEPATIDGQKVTTHLRVPLQFDSKAQ